MDPVLEVPEALASPFVMDSFILILPVDAARVHGSAGTTTYALDPDFESIAG